MRYAAIGIGALVFLILILAVWVVGGINRAVTLDEDIDARWAQVENVLKRRFDLIPNLVETVKGFAAQEKEIFTRIAEARKGYAGASGRNEKVKAASQYESAIARLLMIAERYPNLTSGKAFQNLQFELAGTENRIAVERKRYNDAVRTLNVFTRKFPTRTFSALAGVGPAEYFEVAEEEKEVPKVEFK